MRIFDCVMVCAEADLDLLEARFLEYEDIPQVIHVICEAAADHKGNPKRKFFAESRYSDRFWRFHGKWNHVEVEAHELPSDQLPEIRKNALREYLSHGVSADPDDIILHGNIDEIPARWVIAELAEGRIPVPIALEMRWCAYSPQLAHPFPWRGTVAQEWRSCGSFAGMREKRLTLPAIINAGTRLSMLAEEPQEFHPDGYALRETGIDDTYPRWVRERYGGVTGA
jgi:hypothetical protein